MSLATGSLLLLSVVLGCQGMLLRPSSPAAAAAAAGGRAPVVNLRLKVSPPEDSDNKWRMGGIAVYQKDDERDRSAELEAHWHTERKEVTIDARTNVTRVKSQQDDGEIRKRVGSESERKVRKLAGGEIKGHKVVVAATGDKGQGSRFKQEAQERERRDREHAARAAVAGQKALAALMKKYIDIHALPSIGSKHPAPAAAPPSTTTPAPATTTTTA